MIWKHRTNVGRVVYDEKKSKFRCSDIVRITNSFNPSLLRGESECFLKHWSDLFFLLEVHGSLLGKERLFSEVDKITSFVDRQRELFPGFSGGEFGGGGASGGINATAE